MNIVLKAAQKGFTTVELLITLFIAAMFLFSGYQLYTQVTRSGSDANKMAVVSGRAYEIVKEKARTVTIANTGGCINTSESTPPTGRITEIISGVGSVDFDTTISCPYGISNSIDVFKVVVKASYTRGGITQDVENAIYAN